MVTTSLIYKVLSGKAGQAEKAEVEEWIASSDANKEEYDDIRLLWDQARDTDSSPSDAHFYDGFYQIKTLMQRKRRSRKRKKMTSSAVAMAGVIVIGFFLLYPGSGRESRRYHKFESASLGDIINTLERDYDIRIGVEQRKILTCRFTGTFYNDPVEDIIETVSTGLNLHWESLREGKYRLTGGGCMN
jgi:ferric-dicitrate binding protein FerR (iron transport regulator)